MDLRSVDLNLLPVLDALLRQRSATLAARELDMSQSALSSALGRLRELLGDELFVRTGRGLRPTARAALLAAPVAELLQGVRERILPVAAFDPRAAQRAFCIAHTDAGAYVLWPRIVQAVRARAAGVRLALRVAAGPELAHGLAEGGIDLAVGSFGQLPDALLQQRLFDRRHVAVVTHTHRLAGRTLSLREFAQVPQVVVPGSIGLHRHIDEALARHGLQRRECLEMPSFLMVPPLLAGGEFLAVMPGQLADAFAERWPFVRLPLPIAELPASTVRMVWYRRLHEDAGARWLRQVVAGELAVDPQE